MEQKIEILEINNESQLEKLIKTNRYLVLVYLFYIDQDIIKDLIDLIKDFPDVLLTKINDENIQIINKYVELNNTDISHFILFKDHQYFRTYSGFKFEEIYNNLCDLINKPHTQIFNPYVQDLTEIENEISNNKYTVLYLNSTDSLLVFNCIRRYLQIKSYCAFLVLIKL